MTDDEKLIELQNKKKAKIADLVKQLVKELEPFESKNVDVNSFTVHYDYSHNKHREIHIDFDMGNYEQAIRTNEPNKNYKG